MCAKTRIAAMYDYATYILVISTIIQINVKRENVIKRNKIFCRLSLK